MWRYLIQFGEYCCTFYKKGHPKKVKNNQNVVIMISKRRSDTSSHPRRRAFFIKLAPKKKTERSTWKRARVQRQSQVLHYKSSIFRSIPASSEAIYLLPISSAAQGETGSEAHERTTSWRSSADGDPYPATPSTASCPMKIQRPREREWPTRLLLYFSSSEHQTSQRRRQKRKSRDETKWSVYRGWDDVG